jgi:hypothetical protein
VLLLLRLLTVELTRRPHLSESAMVQCVYFWLIPIHGIAPADSTGAAMQ